MMVLSRCLAAVASILLCVPAAAQAEKEPVSVWIVPFDVLGDEGPPDELGITVADLLTASLSRSPDHAIVDRRALAGVLAEQYEASGGSRTLVWARWMLHGTVTRRGRSLGITAHVTDVASTRILRSAQVSGGVDGLARMVEALAAELARIPRGTERHEEAGNSGETDGAPVANLHFMRGLSRYHAGQYHRALAEFIRSGADPAVEDLSALWRANCYLAVKRHDLAFVELTRLRREGSGRVSPEDVRPLLDACLSHLSAEQIQAYREL